MFFKLNRKGISIIGTVFTLLILGVMGAGLVAMVSMDQESRMRSIRREYSFYAVQAGFEYSLREINEGGYPIVADKVLGDATFTTQIDPSQNKITVTGVATDNSRTHSITTNDLADDCSNIDVSGVSVGGSSNNELLGVVVEKNCLNAINIESILLSWITDVGETVRNVNIAGTEVYDDFSGARSGEIVNITDTRVTGSSVTINSIKFSSSITGKQVTLTLNFTDSSSKSRTLNIP